MRIPKSVLLYVSLPIIIFLGILLSSAIKEVSSVEGDSDLSVLLLRDRLVLLVLAIGVYAQYSRSKHKQLHVTFLLIYFLAIFCVAPFLLTLEKVSYYSLSIVSFFIVVLFIATSLRMSVNLKKRENKNGVTLVIVLIYLFAVQMFLGPVLDISKELLQEFTDSVHNIINKKMLVNLALFFIFWLIVRAQGKFSAKDIGFDLVHLPTAFRICLFSWVLVQFTILLDLFYANKEIFWTFSLLENGRIEWIGELMGYVFGASLFEEAVFRGFLFVQFLLVLEKNVKWNRQVSTLIALIISQLLFSAVHIPGWISSNFGQERFIFEIVDTMAMGMFFMVGYLRTQSLFVPIGMHALLNYGVPLFSGATYEATFYLSSYFIIVIYFLWPNFVNNHSDADCEASEAPECKFNN